MTAKELINRVDEIKSLTTKLQRDVLISMRRKYDYPLEKISSATNYYNHILTLIEGMPDYYPNEYGITSLEEDIDLVFRKTNS